MSILLSTALQLCPKEYFIHIGGAVCTHKEIRAQFNIHKDRVRSIHFDRHRHCMVFEMIKRS